MEHTQHSTTRQPATPVITATVNQEPNSHQKHSKNYKDKKTNTTGDCNLTVAQKPP